MPPKKKPAAKPAAKAKKPAAKPAAKAKAKAKKSPPMKKSSTAKAKASGKSGSPAELIDARIAEYPDWRGALFARLRAIVKASLPDVVEEWKWRGTPVWEQHGIVTTGEIYKSVVKMTFAKGASVADPAKLFNSSLDGNVRRAIDFHEGDKVNEKALKKLLVDAAALNKPKKTAKAK